MALVRQTSTAISDLVLALSAFWGFCQMEQGRIGKYWFLSVMVAASCGTIRFGALLPNLQTEIERYHNKFSWLSRGIGIPSLVAEVCAICRYPSLAQGFTVAAVCNLIAMMVNRDRFSELVVTIGVVTALVLSLLEGQVLVGSGAALLALAGLIGGGEGRLGGMLRVDLLHYGLVAANICMVKGLIK